jgi:hypothetical protein
MENLIDTITFFRDVDTNASLIVIGIMLTWTLAAGSFLLARLGIKPLWVLLLVLPGLNVLAIWLFAYVRWPRYEEAKRRGWTPETRGLNGHQVGGSPVIRSADRRNQVGGSP